jgi:prepilin-type N-terminal cleavage/methylation domain-containing protein
MKTLNINAPPVCATGQPSGATRGFTLIELLVVIIIIALLAALLLPVLANAKKKAQETYCINNMKMFDLGLRMYADDYRNTYLPMDNGAITYQAGGWYTTPSLDSAMNDFAGSTYAAALANAEEALTNSLVFPYVKNVRIFLCPGDTRINLLPGQGFAFCTYSKTQNYAGDSYGASVSYWGCGATCVKDSDVNAPAQTFCIVEDTDWRGVNDGTWVVDWILTSESFTWVDPPAMYHVDTDNWGFIDGHVGSHKWTDPAIISAGLEGAKGQSVANFTGAATSGTDYDYVRSHYRFPGWH